MQADARFKTHLLLPWCAELVRHPAILDVVEKLLDTPNLLCWSSGWAIKAPATEPSTDAGPFYSWHQDSTYAGITEPERIAVVWAALTPSTRDMGCVRVIAGSHLKGQLPHVETFAELNMLARGQAVDLRSCGLDEAAAVDMELAAGEFSVHNFYAVHGSDPNRSSVQRIGLQIVYMPTSAKPICGRGSALLVRGVDEFRHWEPERLAGELLGQKELEEHARAMAIENEAYHAGSQRQGYHR